MSFQRSVSGAHIIIYINSIPYNQAQQLDYTIDYGEEPIYGIDSIFPQEIKTTRVSIQGSISGIRILNENLQTNGIVPSIRDRVFAPYVSLRVFDRRTGEDIMFVPFAKITNEKASVSAKGNMKVSFNFSGLQPQQQQDR
jgi:hypothetical protein